MCKQEIPVYSENITAYDVGDLSKRLLLQIFGPFVFSIGCIDKTELERNTLLIQNHGNTLGTC